MASRVDHVYTLSAQAYWFLRAKAARLPLSARLSHRNSVRLSLCHTGGSGKNGSS